MRLCPARHNLPTRPVQSDGPGTCYTVAGLPDYPHLMSFLDIIGLVGVAAYVAAHFYVQVLRQLPTGRLVVLLNIVGPVCVLVSLTHAFNLASFLTQCFWLGLTLVGWWRSRRLRRSA